MIHEILYLIDQQASSVLTVELGGRGAQPIRIHEPWTASDITLSYVQAKCVVKSLRAAILRMEQEDRVPGPNCQYPGYCLERRRVLPDGSKDILEEWEY